MSTTTPPSLPASFISKAETNTRVNNFMNTKHNILTAAMGGGRSETRSIWYSKLHLEQLLGELNYKNATGLRIYFGAYPETNTASPGQICLLMVPTKAAGSGANVYHEDIIIEEEQDFSERIAGFDPKEIERMYKGFNFGSPCPPACGDPGGHVFPY